MGADSNLLAVYRPALVWRILGIGFGVTMTMLSAILALEFIIGVDVHMNAATAIAVIGGGALFGICFIANTIKYRVVLYQDAIEVRGLFTTRRLEREAIGAKQLILGGPCPNYFLIPRSLDVRKLHVEVSFEQDQTFRTWMESIPDADKAFFRNRRKASYSPRGKVEP